MVLSQAPRGNTVGRRGNDDMIQGKGREGITGTWDNIDDMLFVGFVAQKARIVVRTYSTLQENGTRSESWIDLPGCKWMDGKRQGCI